MISYLVMEAMTKYAEGTAMIQSMAVEVMSVSMAVVVMM
jgi:hypothetical protein